MDSAKWNAIPLKRWNGFVPGAKNITVPRIGGSIFLSGRRHTRGQLTASLERLLHVTNTQKTKSLSFNPRGTELCGVQLDQAACLFTKSVVRRGTSFQERWCSAMPRNRLCFSQFGWYGGVNSATLCLGAQLNSLAVAVRVVSTVCKHHFRQFLYQGKKLLRKI